MKKIILVFCLLLSINVSKNYAQQTYTVGIPSAQFDYYASSQRNTNWCWAACIQMILNYYGINITQEQIVQRSYGTDADGTLPNWAGSFQTITANLNNWNIDNSGNSYVVQAALYFYAPNPSYLIQELSNQHPVLIGYNSGQNSGHAVVITACSYILTNSGPIIQSIVVRDPWPSTSNINKNGRVEYSGIQLASVISAHWYIRVSY